MTPPAAEDPGVPIPVPVLAAGVRAAAHSDHLDATLRGVVSAAVEHLDATFGALGVLDRTGTHIERFVVVGMDAAVRERIGRLPTGEGVLGMMIGASGPLRLDDLTTHPEAVGFPPGHPPMHSFLGMPIRAAGSVFAILFLTVKRPEGSFTDVDERAVQALAATAGLAIENALRVERAEHRRAWAQAGTDIVTALLSGADPDTVLRAIAERVAALAAADSAGVLVPSPDDADVLTVVDAVGLDSEDVEGVRLPLADSQLGVAHRSGVPRIIADVSAAAAEGRQAPVLGELATGYGPTLFIPLGGRPPLGTVVAMRRSGGEPFRPDTLEHASAFAAQAAVALQLARSQQRERRLQVEADRDRIARDLHDHVVQRIFATGLALDRISRSLTADHPEAAARLAERVDELDGTIARIRSAIFELHQPEDDSPDAVRTRIADVVRSITGGQGVRPDVRFKGLDELPSGLVPDVVAVVRELVTNVVRHARASRVAVTVSVTSDVRVVVTDDGTGLPAVTVRSGLTNLTDRAERHGGRLTTSAGPAGTEIRWTVPLPTQR
ncbi:GAF domain-containing sensor histidine kinase [Geodermatophilus sabuli]|uniref:Histidine kinase-, DNA gyrase B-, and HSP90-like ATPase n=1 Tax=Geodermatophilus sabuli TaxID=1564158 RepID=A0A285E8G0_9ACTN|nr:GAF domain-containing protein [Geodermatophilus sabuli]MBB3085184.1 signal transduction histidine kinase [Geodermatophilus sabuli]SNX95408.1 Histidine kinase-, DNA gyrase B-, and HSP90-like ATPase [Geodermatophilus sabuli]